MAKCKSGTCLEGNLGTLELRDGTLGLVEATAATEATTATTTVTEATAATTATTTGTTTATTTETTTTTAATEATTVTTSRAGSAEVEAQRTAVDLSASKLAVGSLGLLNGGVLNVTEALGATGLGVSGQTDAQDATLLSEDITQSILSSAEGQVANEQSVGGGAGLVTVGTGTSLGTVTTLVVLAGSGVVQVDGTTIKLDTLLGLEGLDGISNLSELSVTETTGAAGFTVSHNTARNLAELGELALEPLLIDVPGQVADEQVGGSTLGNLSGLGLLSGSLNLVISLALLGGFGSVLAVLRLRLRVGAVRVGRLL